MANQQTAFQGIQGCIGAIILCAIFHNWAGAKPLFWIFYVALTINIMMFCNNVGCSFLTLVIAILVAWVMV